jgi:hypothetical protein
MAEFNQWSRWLVWVSAQRAGVEQSCQCGMFGVFDLGTSAARFISARTGE